MLLLSVSRFFVGLGRDPAGPHLTSPIPSLVFFIVVCCSSFASVVLDGFGIAHNFASLGLFFCCLLLFLAL